MQSGIIHSDILFSGFYTRCCFATVIPSAISSKPCAHAFPRQSLQHNYGSSTGSSFPATETNRNFQAPPDTNLSDPGPDSADAGTRAVVGQTSFLLVVECDAAPPSGTTSRHGHQAREPPGASSCSTKTTKKRSL